MKQHIKRAALGVLAGLMLLAATACSEASTESTAGSPSAASAQTESTAEEASSSSGYFTDFATESIDDTEYTQDVFKDKDLTLVNVMATWCTPCIAEMPELESLYEEGNVGVVGIVLDTVANGQVDQDALAAAKELQSALGVTYPLLMPDDTGFNGLEAQIQAFPTTYFVNSSGETVGGVYEGSRSLDMWKEVIESVQAS